MKIFGLGNKAESGFPIDSGEPKQQPVTEKSEIQEETQKSTPQVFDITPLNQRFERMEQSMNQVAQLLAYAIQMSQGQGGQQAETQPETQVSQSQQPQAPAINPFYEQVMDYGEEAILRNPRIMGRIVGEIENRLNGVRSQVEAQTELRRSVPEVYDGESVVGKTRNAIRGQLGDVFSRMGISPSAIDTRMMEELVSYAAVGKHMEELNEQRLQKTKTKSPDQQVPFVEGSSAGNLAPLLGSLTDAEQYVAERFGDTAENYAKTKKRLLDLGLLERR